MTHVLVVEDDENLLKAILRDLRQHGYDVRGVTSVEGAMDELVAVRADILLTDLRIRDGDGLQLLDDFAQRCSGGRAVLMSAFATARDHEAAVALGAVEVLCKPFDGTELLSAIHKAEECREGFRGSIHGLSLVDMLQMYHFARRSVVINIASRPPAQIFVQEGEVVQALLGNLEGEDAMRQILAKPSGSIRTSPMTSEPKKTIDRPLDSLLLDTLRVVDEEDRDVTLDDLELFGNVPESTPVGTQERQPWNSEERQMGKIDDACKEIVEKVDGAVAAGVVDLDTGMLLGIHNNAGYSQTLNEVVAAATMDVFRGANVSRISQMVRAQRGVPEDGKHYFREVHITSENNFHFAKTIKGGKAVIMLVTGKGTNIGMGWASLKSVIPSVEPHVP